MLKQATPMPSMAEQVLPSSISIGPVRQHAPTNHWPNMSILPSPTKKDVNSLAEKAKHGMLALHFLKYPFPFFWKGRVRLANSFRRTHNELYIVWCQSSARSCCLSIVWYTYTI